MKGHRIVILVFAILLAGCVSHDIFRHQYGEACQFENLENNPDPSYDDPGVCAFSQKDYHASFGVCKPRLQPDRELPNPYHRKCRHEALQEYTSPASNRNYHLAFVEYDDHGQLHRRPQLNAAIDYVKAIARKDEIILVVYVHGWHHTAGVNFDKNDDDTDIQKFRGLLEQLALSETVRLRNESRAIEENVKARKKLLDELEASGMIRVRNDSPPVDKTARERKVVGVYIGWRGETIELPGFRELTFWARKNVAHKIGQLGVSEVLLELEKIVDPKRAATVPEKNGKKHYMIVIGHSFGAAVVASGLQKILLDRHLLAMSRNKRGETRRVNNPVKGFADLTVLINPAFEAMLFSTLYDISQNYSDEKQCSAYPREQTPRLVALTARNDLPTRVAFPLGRGLVTLLESHREYSRNRCKYADGSTETIRNERQVIDQEEANTTALGHFKPYLTHELEPRKDSLLRASIERDGTLRSAWKRQENEALLCFEHVALKHLGRSDPFNPYLNIRVSDEIIRDHNDIWDIKLQSFLQALIKIATSPDTGNQPGRYEADCSLKPVVADIDDDDALANAASLEAEPPAR